MKEVLLIISLWITVWYTTIIILRAMRGQGVSSVVFALWSAAVTTLLYLLVFS